MTTKSPSKVTFFYYILFFILLGCALLIRIYDLSDLPLDFHPTRQLHSALMARGMYYHLTGDTSDKAKQAIQQWKAEGLIEPPLLEWLTAYLYYRVGTVDLQIPRLIAIAFWLLASIPLFISIKRENSGEATLLGVAFFLFLPYSIIASRSFQPETLLVLFLSLFIMSLFFWNSTRSWKWAILTGLLGGFTIFIKTTASFFVAGMWLGWLLSARNWQLILKEKKLWGSFFLTILPYSLYVIYGLWIDKSYASQFSLRFFPSMWGEISFYLRWLSNLRRVVGIEWLILAFIGTFLAEKKTTRNILIGGWFGYLLLGFTLSYHISTHDYYHLPLLLLIAFGLSFLFQSIFFSCEKRSKIIKNLSVVCLLLLMGIYAMDARSELKKVDYRPEVAYWESVATFFKPTDKVVALSQDYGYRLAYWGWVNARNWPSLADIQLRLLAGQGFSLEDYFKEYTTGYDYFLVTDLDEFARQPQLKELLYQNYPLISTKEGTLLFDLTQEKRQGK